MHNNHPSPRRRLRWPMLAAAIAYTVIACAVQRTPDAAVHRWWSGLGPVLPHDTFPGDCTLCHVGDSWHQLVDDFDFDHEAHTGVALHGAHATAQCLRCHNDRGPVADFAARGCAGCHEDVHSGDLGPTCTDCHGEQTWHPTGQIELHARTRFPLTGAHLAVSCHRCHPGSFVGNFQPIDHECSTCHALDAAATQNPPHVPLGWVQRCDRCHPQTRWSHARVR